MSLRMSLLFSLNCVSKPQFCYIIDMLHFSSLRDWLQLSWAFTARLDVTEEMYTSLSVPWIKSTERPTTGFDCPKCGLNPRALSKGDWSIWSEITGAVCWTRVSPLVQGTGKPDKPRFKKSIHFPFLPQSFHIHTAFKAFHRGWIFSCEAGSPQAFFCFCFFFN